MPLRKFGINPRSLPKRLFVYAANDSMLNVSLPGANLRSASLHDSHFTGAEKPHREPHCIARKLTV
jgi:hypothetical protein